MTDNITLPREVGEAVLRFIERHRDWSDVRQHGDHAAALRAALAAPRLEVAVDPRLTAEEAAAISAALAAPKQEPVRCNPADYCAARHMNLYTAPKHPGYIIGSHWLETAYSRICAGEAEADVLRDCGWERTNESLKATRDRQASMLRRLEEREAELDAEIGRLREELRQSSIDSTRAEVERLRGLLNRLEYSADGHIKRYPEEEEVNAALRRGET